MVKERRERESLAENAKGAKEIFLGKEFSGNFSALLCVSA